MLCLISKPFAGEFVINALLSSQSLVLLYNPNLHVLSKEHIKKEVVANERLLFDNPLFY